MVDAHIRDVIKCLQKLFQSWNNVRNKVPSKKKNHKYFSICRKMIFFPLQIVWSIIGFYSTERIKNVNPKSYKEKEPRFYAYWKRQLITDATSFHITRQIYKMRNSLSRFRYFMRKFCHEIMTVDINRYFIPTTDATNRLFQCWRTDKVC